MQKQRQMYAYRLYNMFKILSSLNMKVGENYTALLFYAYCLLVNIL